MSSRPAAPPAPSNYQPGSGGAGRDRTSVEFRIPTARPGSPEDMGVLRGLGRALAGLLTGIGGLLSGVASGLGRFVRRLF
jgi:hypothetical protein